MAKKRKKQEWDGSERRREQLVLVAGDDAGTNELLSRVLHVRGFRAITSSTVDGALRAAHEQLPRCIVIDLSSKGVGSSMQLLDGIRQSEDAQIRNTRVVIVARSSANRNFVFQSGADGFLERPFHADDLVALVAEVLAVPPEERAIHRRRMLENT